VLGSSIGRSLRFFEQIVMHRNDAKLLRRFESIRLFGSFRLFDCGIRPLNLSITHNSVCV
jgi:hypothetical protein